MAERNPTQKKDDCGEVGREWGRSFRILKKPRLAKPD